MGKGGGKNNGRKLTGSEIKIYRPDYNHKEGEGKNMNHRKLLLKGPSLRDGKNCEGNRGENKIAEEKGKRDAFFKQMLFMEKEGSRRGNSHP